MDYKIVIDSCGEIPERFKKTGNFVNVPLELEIDGHRIVDDETFDQLDFLHRVAVSSDFPRSSCPSPERYLRAYEEGDAKHVYCATLSSNLSGSYNSAMLAKQMFEEKHPDRKIHVFDSCSASMGETLLGIKAAELEEQGLPFEEIVAKTEQFKDECHTYFVLESLDGLRKNGRLSGVKFFLANALNIKPVCGSTPDGHIQQLSQGRGINKALKVMNEIMAKEMTKAEEKYLVITHTNNPERAQKVKEDALRYGTFKDVFVENAGGVSSLYAGDGGIILVV